MAPALRSALSPPYAFRSCGQSLRTAPPRRLISSVVAAAVCPPSRRGGVGRCPRVPFAIVPGVVDGPRNAALRVAIVTLDRAEVDLAHPHVVVEHLVRNVQHDGVRQVLAEQWHPREEVRRLRAAPLRVIFPSMAPIASRVTCSTSSRTASTHSGGITLSSTHAPCSRRFCTAFAAASVGVCSSSRLA
jgi:hypothetical protein